MDAGAPEWFPLAMSSPQPAALPAEQSTLLAISERVTVRPRPALDHPDVARWRPATMDDVAVVTHAQKAMDAVDHPDWTTPAEDIADELGAEHVDLVHDSILALDAEGAVIGWGLVEPSRPTTERVQVFLSGGVVPAHRGRGLGRLLLAWQLARATEQLVQRREALPAWVRCTVDERNPTGLALVDRAGMRPVRWFTSMERAVLTPDGAASLPAVPAPPDGVRLVRYTSDRAEVARLARNDAFRDHWGSRPTPPQQWSQTVTSELMRADLSWLAVDEAGRVLGLAIVVANPEDWPLQGYTSSYLAVLGVVRAARGQRLAPALVGAVMRATAEAGLERVVLDVDTENPTGALALYERLGMEPTARSIEHVLDL